MAFELLGQGEIFDIVAEDRIVCCTVVNRSEVDPSAGARCAKEMHDILAARVLTPHAPYDGLIFDVSRGPAAFGPKTRAFIIAMLSAARTANKPIAVRVGAYAIQYLQFSSLCRTYAPDLAKLAVGDKAEQWIRARAVACAPVASSA